MKSWEEFQAKRAAAKVRKVKRAEKRKELFEPARSLPKSALKKKVWQLVSMFVRERDRSIRGNVCRICLVRGIEVAYHIVPSGDGAGTRYDPKNLVGACHGCNYGEKNHRFAYRVKHIAIFGKAYVEELESKAAAMRKYSSSELHEIAREFKRKLEAREWS